MNNKKPCVNDVFSIVEYEGGERPEYILKNGSAFNIYGAIKYIQAQQEQIKAMRNANRCAHCGGMGCCRCNDTGMRCE